MKLWPNIKELKDYRADDRHFTSKEEMDLIHEKLHFDEATDDDLFNYRTLVVCIWREMRDHAEADGKPDEADEIWNAMMSITAVIDDEMWKRGMAL